ncbi:BC1872 family protein [Brevibacillus agri]|uniref:BC1872 family protein n=1 Tax=Brevibacillus agri TaxID=51101 RepID=UPI003D2157D4
MDNEQQIIETLATKVMGWSTMSKQSSFWLDFEGHLRPKRSWNPLQNIEHAWQVVEKLESMGMAVELYTETYAPRNCKIWLDGTVIAEEEGETIREAICKAARKVVD